MFFVGKSRVVRLFSLPFDRAADRGDLFCRAATAFGNLAHRFKQLALGLCRAGVAPGSIESATVLQFKPIVVTEKIGRTDGAVSAGDCLAFVNQIRERKVERFGPMAHVFW